MLLLGLGPPAGCLHGYVSSLPLTAHAYQVTHVEILSTAQSKQSCPIGSKTDLQVWQLQQTFRQCCNGVFKRCDLLRRNACFREQSIHLHIAMMQTGNDAKWQL